MPLRPAHLARAAVVVAVSLAVTACQEQAHREGSGALAKLEQAVLRPPVDTVGDVFIGQMSGSGQAANLTDEKGFSWPEQIAIDTSASPPRLYLADQSNNRVLAWANVQAFVNGAPAAKVFGQPDMYGTSCNGNLSPTATSMCYPRGVAVDAAGNLYVADSSNQRVLEFNAPFGAGDTVADRVFGQGGAMNTNLCNYTGAPGAQTLCQPGAVAVDAAGNLFVVDQQNNRVLEFFTPLTTDTNADVVLGQPDMASSAENRVSAQGLDNPSGVAIDRSITPNRIYVADPGNNRVLGWTNATTFANGAAANIVIGQPTMSANGCNTGGASASTLCYPRGLAVDGSGNLLVADYQNNRVLGYTTPFTSDKVADKVWGQIDYASTACGVVGAATLCNPWGVAVNAAGDLFVADSNNSRVVKFNGGMTGDAIADVVYGQGGNFGSGACNTAGLSATSLCYPHGLAFDSAGNFYVADYNNSRVLEFNTAPADTIADRVFGQASMTGAVQCALSPSGLCYPSAVTVDSTGTLWIGDDGNSRTVGYLSPLTTDSIGDRVLGAWDLSSPGCWPASNMCSSQIAQLASDTSGGVYATDQWNNRVLAYNSPGTTDSYVDRVLGQSNFSSNTRNFVQLGGMSQPSGVGVDRSSSPNRLYVVDGNNNRMLGWPSIAALTNGQLATKVFGQPDGTTATCDNGGATGSSMCMPTQVAVDNSGNVYLADYWNSRVLEYDSPFGGGDVIADHAIGQPNVNSLGCNASGVNALTMCGPRGVAVDASGNVWVNDNNNNRLLKFNLPLTTDVAADGVLGQPGFSQHGANWIDAAGLNQPAALAIDTSVNPNRVYVADTVNNRVLGWPDVTAYAGGAPATLVFGQPDVTSSGCNLSGVNSTSLCSPMGVAVDGAGRLYVADTNNNRVLIYDSPFTTDTTADKVMGQPDFFNSGCPSPATTTSLCSPNGVAADSAGNVWVADTVDNRVLGFNTPRTGDVSADKVIGQPDFAQKVPNNGGLSATALSAPSGVAIDISVTPNRLYVADTGNARVLEYDAALTGDGTADLVIGQLNMTANGCGTTNNRLCAPRGVAVDPLGNVHVADTNNSRVLQFNLPKTTDQSADAVFGQGDFTSANCNWPSPWVASSQGICSPYGVAVDSVGSLYVADYGNNRIDVYLSNRRPTAAPLSLTPALPRTADPLVGTYTYADADGDAESGTEIRWYKGGVLQAAYNNLLTVPAAATTKGDAWYFTVKPKDGSEFGTLQTSATVTIANTAPVATLPAVGPALPKTNDVLTATFTFADADGDAEAASEFHWFLNGVEQPGLLNSRTVAAALTTRGQLWYFSTRPGDGTDLGALVTSATVTIGNTAPSASSVQVTPASPTAASTLTASYAFADPDGDAELGSEVRWYKNGVLQAAYNDARNVPPPLTLGDQWYYTLRPRDGLDFGTLVTSTTAIVGSSAPAASNLAVLPVGAKRADTLSASYLYTDPDGQPETASQVRWFKNGTAQPALDDLRNVAPPQTRGDTWYFTVRPCDNTPLCGALQTSPTITILNTAPTAVGQAVSPAAPVTDDALTANYAYADADGDPEGTTAIHWFKNGVEQVALLNLRVVPNTATTRGDAWYFTVTPKDGADFGPLVTAAVVTIGNTPPIASALVLSPAVPRVTDALTAAWAFADADADLQSGSEIHWFVNGVEDATLVGSLTVPPSKLVKGAQWRFTVRPKDGIDFGAVVPSPTVTVANSPPVATALAVSPAAPLAGQVLTASYNYTDADGDTQSGSELRWFNSGVEVPALLNLTQVPAGTTARGQRWSFSVRPKDGIDFGLSVTSAEVSIANSAPSASGLAINPSQPKTADDLVAAYAYSDRDGDAETGTEVRWYKNGVEQTALADLRTVPNAATTRGDSWYCTVRPKDGLDFGQLVTSAPVTILNTAPVATAVTISPLSPRVTDAIVASYAYSDADGDAQQGSVVRWFKNGVEQVALVGLLALAPGTALAGETWYFTVAPRDGVAFGAVVTSTSVIVGSSAPVATALAITPLSPRTDDGLTATYLYTDPDGTAESGSEIRWFRNTVEVVTLLNLRTVPPAATTRGESWNFTVRPKDGTLFGALQTSPVAVIGNTPPVATNVLVTPAAPTTVDPLQAAYTFTDADGDTERTSEIHWFRNGIEVVTLVGQTTVPATATAKREVWYFRVRPGDGTDLGTAEVSTPVFIANSPPVANAGPDQTITPTQALTRVTLDGTASTDPDADVLSYTWVEGTTQLATGASPAVDLPLGTHTITLTVSDGDVPSTDTVVITIPDQKPVATVPADFSLPPGRLTLAGTATDALGRPLTFAWRQISGDPVTLLNPGQATASAFVLKAGPRVFELTVTANTTVGDPKRVTVTTLNLAPWASAPPRQVVLVGSQVSLDATHSSDPNADTLSFTWSLDPGTNATLTDADLPVAHVTPNADGRFGVSLVANDGALASTPATAEVIALDPANHDHTPVANAGPDGVGDVGRPITLDGRASYDTDGDLLGYGWRKISGPPGVLTPTTSATPSFVASAPGTAVFGLVVGDGRNSSAEDTVSFDVIDPAANQRPIARVAADFATTVATSAQLDGSKSSDPDGDAITFAWAQVDGPAVTLDDPTAAKPNFVALRPGVLRFSLTVSDTKALSAPAIVTVLVSTGTNRPPVANAGADQRVLFGSDVQLDGSASTDPDGDGLHWVWEQILGPPVVLAGTPDKPTFTPPNMGRFRFRLVVWDSEAPSFPDDVEIIVSTHGANDQQPVANAGVDQEVALGSVVTLDGSGSYDPDPGDRLTYEWTLIAFPTGAEPTLEGASTATPSFTPTTAGPYQLRLRVGDGDLFSEPSTVNVLVGTWASGQGCGCASGGSTGALAGVFALALFAARRRRRLVAPLLLLALVAGSGPASAAAKKTPPKAKASKAKKAATPPPAAKEPAQPTSDDTPTVGPKSDAPLAAGQADALAGPPNPYFDEARTMFMNFQFDGILAKLEFALAVKGVTVGQKIEIYKLMAMTHLSFDDTAKAEEAFIKVLELKPDYELAGGGSPKIRASLAAAQKTWHARQAVKLEHQPPKVGSAGVSTTVDVVAVAGADRVAQMTLHYRPQGSTGGFSQTTMARGEGGAFSATVPNVFPGPAGVRTIEYFIRARDGSGALLAGFGEETSPLEMKVETVESSTPVYKSPFLWAGVAVVVAGSIAAPFLLRQNARVPTGTLGIEHLK